MLMSMGQPGVGGLDSRVGQTSAARRRRPRARAGSGVAAAVVLVGAAAAVNWQAGTAGTPSASVRAAGAATAATPRLTVGGYVLSYVPQHVSAVTPRPCSHAPFEGLCWGGHSGAVVTAAQAPGQGDTLLWVTHVPSSVSAGPAVLANAQARAGAVGPARTTVSTPLVNGKGAVMTSEVGAPGVDLTWLLADGSAMIVTSLGVPSDEVLRLAESLR